MWIPAGKATATEGPNTETASPMLALLYCTSDIACPLVSSVHPVRWMAGRGVARLELAPWTCAPRS
eukprot:14419931-Alexandrium_andersonii.AAC.1